VTAPLPPGDLATRDPLVLQLGAGEIVHRFFTAAYEPLYFDRSLDGRLNAPDGSYGVLYCAKTQAGAFAETFLRQPGRTLLPADLIQSKAYVRLQITRRLRLIRLAGRGLARLGATAEVVHGGLPYDVPQAWSRALRHHPSTPDGIAYHARHDDAELCYALFDHAQDAIEAAGLSRDLDVQAWFWDLADEYGVGLAP
jgi:hypothetical protein